MAEKHANTPSLSPSCWIITEGLAGTENQCLGVAEALGLKADIFRISLRQPWKMLSPYLAFEKESTFTPALTPPWPDLLITSGRKSIAASRFIKRMSRGRTITVHLQDPRIGAHHFDLVAVPAHDRLRGPNVIVTTAAPNRITNYNIETARLDFQNIEKIKKSRIAVLVGGSSRAYKFTVHQAETLLQQLKHLESGLMLTCSRRTDPAVKTLLETGLDNPSNYVWDGTGNNPYLAFLGWADAILVTADSVSMISEACTTGKPVYMIPLEGGSSRITAFHDLMIKRGALRIFEGKVENFSYPPLNDAKLVAEAIKTRFQLFTP